MTDQCYHVKEWLNRNYNKAVQLEADRRMLEQMSNRLGSGVAKYETDGTQGHDADQARARHEDALLEYSMQKQKVENEERELIAGMALTRKAIDELSDPALQAVAIDRYINRLRWADIATLEHVSIAQVHRYHATMLERMVDVVKKYE